MVSTGVNYTKLKTNLRLSINRLKLLEKKKTELAQKSRKEIGEYIVSSKYERAKIRVEHIIREDYIVEAMELVEMYCDLLLARFGLIQQMKTLDDGLSEAISSLIWVAPRLQTDVQELKTISDLLTYKYGKPYAQACRENALKTVNEKLMIKMGVQAPPKILVEKYLIEIAKSQNISYEPDADVLREDEVYCAEEATSGYRPQGNCLIDLGNSMDNRNNGFPPSGPSGGGGGGGGGMGAYGGGLPPLPSVPPSAPYPTAPNTKPIGFNFNNMPEPSASMPSGPPPHYDSVMPSTDDKPMDSKPKALPRGNAAPKPNPNINLNDSFPELPSVPTGGLPDIPTNDPKDDGIDFDDLSKRFEDLKKRK
ncbi:unnamed protein product [Medioppia subpectinata]|uniref:IST1 homolog n=2 Tax=Medioppia subpectinata TaxID=1979941 RepID=A0A7R9Q432_9ACAR|nr:unnamed protein product [Medioppia subpectinata]CAG2111962.1 unnamed protein product [Medioppia subpectinata]